MQLLLIVPATSASAECSFSRLRRVTINYDSGSSEQCCTSTCKPMSDTYLNTVMDDFIGLNDLWRRLFPGAVNIKLFAENIKLYLEITDIFTLPTLQNSIDDIKSWATIWQLKLAINKCQHIHISLSRTAVLPKFSLNGNIISSCSPCRDLGIIIDSRLSFIDHINSMVAKAHMRASQILVVFLAAIHLF